MTAQRISRVNTVIALYFIIAVILVIGEATKNRQIIATFKPTLIPLLAILYYLTSSKRDPVYFAALLLAVSSNILFLFTGELVVYGIIAFLAHRILAIALVVKHTDKFHFFAFGIAIIPFLFVYIYLLDMTDSVLAAGFYPALANALVMSVLAALSLSNYVFDDNRRNSWLLISSLLFVVLMFIFVIERFYLENPVFRPLSVIIFSAAHFAFYKYLILSESGSVEPDET